VLKKEAELSRKVEQACKWLHLKQHIVGKDVTLYGPGDLEGHKGQDGRFYIVGTHRSASSRWFICASLFFLTILTSVCGVAQTWRVCSRQKRRVHRRAFGASFTICCGRSSCGPTRCLSAPTPSPSTPPLLLRSSFF
jgi:hypothetical protein